MVTFRVLNSRTQIIGMRIVFPDVCVNSLRFCPEDNSRQLTGRRKREARRAASGRFQRRLRCLGFLL
jgi:hypothetical protein